MSAPTLISVEEYLASSYKPDCDYVDGHIEERNLGERTAQPVAGPLVAAIVRATAAGNGSASGGARSGKGVPISRSGYLYSGAIGRADPDEASFAVCRGSLS